MEVFLAVLAVVGSLGGVALGRYLDRTARREERTMDRAESVRSEAADVLGEARIVLGAMQGSPGLLESDEIEKRRAEADRIRPKLMRLAVLWPDAADDLQAVERFMAFVPNRLRMILDLVNAGRDENRRHLTKYEKDQRLAVEGLTRVIDMVPQGLDGPKSSRRVRQTRST